MILDGHRFRFERACSQGRAWRPCATLASPCDARLVVARAGGCSRVMDAGKARALGPSRVGSAQWAPAAPLIRPRVPHFRTRTQEHNCQLVISIHSIRVFVLETGHTGSLGSWLGRSQPQTQFPTFRRKPVKFHARRYAAQREFSQFPITFTRQFLCSNPSALSVSIRGDYGGGFYE